MPGLGIGFGMWLATAQLPGDLGVVAVDETTTADATIDDRTVTNIAAAAGKWEPSDIHDDGSGKVDKWATSGTGGTDFDLLQSTSGSRPSLAATGNRAGGPAVQLVRATPTQLATIAFALNQPNTQIWIAKTTSGSDNQRLSDGRVGNTRSLYQFSNVTRLNCGAEINGTVNNVVAGTWYGWTGIANGISSYIRVGTDSKSGDAGSNTASGIVLGDFGLGAGGAAFDGMVEWGAFWTSALSTDAINDILSYKGVA